MEHEPGSYRWPYRRGDYDLVDTSRTGTYWRSPEGIVVRLASAERTRAMLRRPESGWRLALTMLVARVSSG